MIHHRRVRPHTAVPRFVPTSYRIHFRSRKYERRTEVGNLYHRILVGDTHVSLDRVSCAYLESFQATMRRSGEDRGDYVEQTFGFGGRTAVESRSGYCCRCAEETHTPYETFQYQLHTYDHISPTRKGQAARRCARSTCTHM